MPLEVQGQRQNICESQICKHTLQEQVLGEKVWLCVLRTKSVLKSLEASSTYLCIDISESKHRKG